VVTNNGPSTVSSVTLTDTIAAALLNPSFGPSAGIYDLGTVWSGAEPGDRPERDSSRFIQGRSDRFFQIGGYRRPNETFAFAPRSRKPRYFHGDNGAGIGASHHTGWTALVANLIDEWH
jgi:hypothetical protein